MTTPALATEAAAARGYPSRRFNQRERKLLASVKTYVDSLSPDTIITTQGDLIIGDASGNGVRLAKGTSGLPLVAGASTSAYTALTNSGLSASAAIDFSKLAALTSTNILVGSSGNVATSVAVTGDVTIGNTGVTAIGAAKVTQAMLTAPSTAGLQASRTAYAVFDPSALSGDRTIAAHALAATLPINAFVTGFWYWVETTLTSATDAATVAFSIEAANDEVTAIAISDGTNPWDTTAKPVEGITKIETTSTWLRTTAARAITATVAVEALTAGRIHIWADYKVNG